MTNGLTIELIRKRNSKNKPILFFNALTSQFVESSEGLIVWGYTENADKIIINLVNPRSE